VCECTVGRLQRTLAYDDFAEADAAIRAGRSPTPEAQRLFDVAASACRDAQ
jgi:hypothetical protein